MYYINSHDFKVVLNLSKNDVQNPNILIKKKGTKHPYNKDIIFVRSLIHINTDSVANQMLLDEL